MKLDNITDEQLIKKIREEDIELYSEIIKRYQNKLYRYLCRLCSKTHSDEIEDVLQNIFIKVYKNLYGFNLDKKFSSWIYRIAHNEAINYVKKYAKERVSLEEVEHQLKDDKENVDELLDKKLTREQLESYLNNIKAKYREPLILFYFEERSYEEISDILRIPVNTVGTLISRGKKIIKTYIQSKNNI